MNDRPESPEGRRTAYGERLWVDVLKTTGVALATLLVMFSLGAFLILMIISPWGRASPDCSMFCVMEKRIDAFLDGKKD